MFVLYAYKYQEMLLSYVAHIYSRDGCGGMALTLKQCNTFNNSFI